MNLPQYVLTVTNFLGTQQTLYQKNLIFFVSLQYSVSFSAVDVLTSKGHFFLKQINSESLFCYQLVNIIRHQELKLTKK